MDGEPGGLPALRQAREDDAPRIVSLIEEVYREYGFIFVAGDELPDVLAFAESYDGLNASLFVAEEEGALAGSIGVKLHRQRAAVEIKRLYVRAASRGKGLGGALVRTALGWARERGARRIELWSDTRFTRAHRLYESLGFGRGGVRRLHDANDSTEYEYTRAP
jgi:putative acetyltransferase